MNSSEFEYIINKLNNIKFDRNLLTIFCEDSKYIMGIISPHGQENDYSKIAEYNTIYNSVIDLNDKILLSFQKALGLVEDNEGFNYDELSYYYIENAIFRIFIIWDMLAHLYRLYYNISDIDIDKVYASKIFNPKNKYCNKFKDKAKEIHDYFTEDEDTRGENEWKGNHEYLRSYRNKLTHRNSPSVMSFSNFDINFAVHPLYIIKRALEDYEKAVFLHT